MKISGIILKQALQKAGLKQEEAASLLKISRPTLSVWCNKDYLTDEIIFAVKEKLNIDLTNVTTPNDTEKMSKLIESLEKIISTQEKLINQYESENERLVKINNSLLSENELLRGQLGNLHTGSKAG